MHGGWGREVGGKREISVFPAQFCCDTKTAWKNKVLFFFKEVEKVAKEGWEGEKVVSWARERQGKWWHACSSVEVTSAEVSLLSPFSKIPDTFATCGCHSPSGNSFLSSLATPLTLGPQKVPGPPGSCFRPQLLPRLRKVSSVLQSFQRLQFTNSLPLTFRSLFANSNPNQDKERREQNGWLEVRGNGDGAKDHRESLWDLTTKNPVGSRWDGR